MKRCLVIAFLIFAGHANAHEVRPAYLELTERAPNEFDVLWKVPALGGTLLAGEQGEPERPQATSGATQMLPCGCPAPTIAQLSRGVPPLHPVMPKDSRIIVPPHVERLQGAELQRWTIRVPHGLDGWEVTIHGLPATMADVLVRVALLDGRVVSRIVRPEAPSFTFSAATAGPTATGYFQLGVEHILLGVDHLLFVLCLLLLVRSVAQVLKTITAFTLAHSITLALATLGYVHVPSAPVEATIALSIVFLATEIAKRRVGQPSLTERKTWVIAFIFGLLHGFGFAGALSQIGLPAREIPLSLLLFNVGVEAGQIIFVASVLLLVLLARRVVLTPPVWLRPVSAYSIGTIASFWLIARIAAPFLNP
jgi:hydrogenase/urease accessory protein HupE